MANGLRSHTQRAYSLTPFGWSRSAPSKDRQEDKVQVMIGTLTQALL